MRQVILTVPDDQFAPLMKVLKALPFAVEITEVVEKPKKKKPDTQK
ncbi:hypothetical protein [Hymenobacter rubidus]|nr:hypothetical protein [Hymenobacter rubidus]